MSLRRRLERLEQTGCLGSTPPVAKQGRDLADLLSGEVVENRYGSFYRHRRSVSLESHHGPTRLSRARSFPVQKLGDLYDRLQGLDTEKVIFFDTETTGLAGGSGTYAFLVGLAWFEGEHLQVEQLFMREHKEEKAMLCYLEGLLENAGGLVSFNGKTYDAQLLTTRFMMNRMRVLLDESPHLDLLHLCRRVWGPGLVDCRLETLEEQILGRPRTDDTPGWMVPQIYFRYLRNRDARPLLGVAEHNHRDLLAMVGLMGRLACFLDAPLEPREPVEDYSLGRLFEDLGQLSLARQLLERALERGPLPADHRRSGMLRLARLYRRQRRRGEAVELWKALLKERPEDLEAAEEMAKHLEHQLGNYQLALRLVERTLKIGRFTPGRRRSFLSRRDRLRQRLQRAAGAAEPE